MVFAFALSLAAAFFFFPLEVAVMGIALLLTLFALSIASTLADHTLPMSLPWSGKLFWLTMIVGILAWLASIIVFVRTGRWWLMGMIFPTLYFGQRAAKYQIDVYSSREQEHHQTRT